MQSRSNNRRDRGNSGGKPLLTIEEIEKRLVRAQKYDTTEGVDELKAMLRKHWWQKGLAAML